jgi:phosphate-selective porin OprO/OprP
VSQLVVFSYVAGVTATGDRTRLSPQASFFLGPVGLLAEYVQSKATATRQDSTTQVTTTADVTNKSWSVTGSVFLTGEDATYGSARPKSFFVPSAGTWGAVQLVARVNRIDIDAAAFANGFADPAKSVSRASAWGVGVNWIWNTNLKYVLDYEQTSFKGGAVAGADRETEKSLQTRLQLSF